MSRLKKHSVLYSIVISEILGFIITVFMMLSSFIKYQTFYLDTLIIFPWIYGTFIVYPIMLTVINIINLFKKDNYRVSRYFDLITFVLGIIYSFLIIVFFEIEYYADWTEILYNRQVHTPIWTKAYPTVICLVVVAVIGYFVLSYVKLEKLPPLITVLCMSAMYIGIMECLLWSIQIINERYWILCVFPFNCIIISIKTIRYKILEWQNIEEGKRKGFKNKFFNQCNERLMNASQWPLTAFLLMWPLLGIMMCILILFNQQPDYFIKSYLNTSDWNLSQKVSPQNIYYDEHYLCTVAAGGHKNIVKPIRRGIRHGHEVIVNRQLCIANAFEQILEERTPMLHKHIRHFYDTYGFPIARLIHSPYIADIIYFIMKPLEWLFLIVIYSCDVKPENRIAVQYLPKIKEEL